MTSEKRSIGYMLLADVEPAKRNPKLHDEEALDASLGRFGFTEPVLLDERTGRLVAGHGRLDRLKAAEARGDEPPEGIVVTGEGWQVPVVKGWASANDLEAEAYLVASNRLVESGGWDNHALTELLDAVATETEQSLDGVGYTTEDMEALLVEISDDPYINDDESNETVTGRVRINQPGDPVTKSGDIWEIGEHRLMCGDARDPKQLGVLMGGVDANMAFTSPPYASQRTYDDASFEPILPDGYVDWFRAVADGIAEHLASDGSWIFNIKEHAEDGVRHRYVLDLMIAHIDWGWRYIDEYVWLRYGYPIDPGSAGRFKNGWERVLHYTRQPRHAFYPAALRTESDRAFTYDHALRMGGDQHEGFINTGRAASTKGDGLAFPSNVLPHFDNIRLTDHPAAFGKGLPGWFIQGFTLPGDVVLDPFVGSGSTLAAAHDLGRVGYGMEISPGYCDMALARMELETEITPVREGKPTSFLHLVPQ